MTYAALKSAGRMLADSPLPVTAAVLMADDAGDCNVLQQSVRSLEQRLIIRSTCELLDERTVPWSTPIKHLLHG